MDNVVSVAAGQEHTVAIRSDGSLYSWGGNRLGQLGNGTRTILYFDWTFYRK